MSWRILIFLDHSKLKNVHINLENQVALRWIGLVLTGAMFLILTRYQPKIFRETFDLQVTYDSNRILGEKWGVNIWKMKIDLQVFLKVLFGSNSRSSNGDPPDDLNDFNRRHFPVISLSWWFSHIYTVGTLGISFSTASMHRVPKIVPTFSKQRKSAVKK